MLLDIIKADYIDEFKINIQFENGKEGIVDFKEFTEHGGVFYSLKDKNYFKKFYINRELGTICWPDGQDIAPEAIYSKIKNI